MVFAVAASGRLTSRAPLSHSRRASQWIAATILKVTSGSAKNATAELGVDLAWEGNAYDPSPISSSSSDAYRLIAALASNDGRTPVAPALVTATTDSRSMVGIAKDIYRFQPIVASLKDFEMIHGTNEHMTLDNLRRTVEFYARLIATAAR